MRPREQSKRPDDLFRPWLDHIIDMKHEPVRLADVAVIPHSLFGV